MPEIRKNYLTDEWVIISEERNKRPTTFSSVADRKKLSADDCPFCEHNSQMTPMPYKIGFGGKIRIVPNKYPALSKDCAIGYGYHDVVIDTENHNQQIENFTDEHIFELLKLLRERLSDIKKDDKIDQIQVFKNQGNGAGASIDHSHWQIIAMPFVSCETEVIERKFSEYYDANNSCYLCDLEDIYENDKYFITQKDSFLSFTYFASRFYNEVCIMPNKNNHLRCFTDLNDNQLFDFGIVLKRSVFALKQAMPNLDYNICFFSPSLHRTSAFHFFATIIPRKSSLAGFEFATKTYINAMRPESTAKLLRDILLDQ